MKAASPRARLSEPRISLADLAKEYGKINNDLEAYLSGTRKARADWPESRKPAARGRR